MVSRKVTNKTLKEIFKLQANVMHNHVRVMLALINSYQNEYVEPAHLSVMQIQHVRTKYIHTVLQQLEI